MARSPEFKDKENHEGLELHGGASPKGEVVLWGILQVQGEV